MQRADMSMLDEGLDLLRPEPGACKLVRFGPNGDGGYLLPDDLEGLGGVVSPGVSDEVGFDLVMAEMGLPVHMYDASVAGPPILNPLFTFTPKFLDVFSSPTTVTLSQTVEAFEDDLILQMDIEGAEYRVLGACPSSTLKRFRVMVIEFHHLDRLLATSTAGGVLATLTRLRETHALVHVHVNNFAGVLKVAGQILPDVVEVTFHRRDRIQSPSAQPQVPHPLDSDCDPAFPSAPIPRQWRA